MTCMEGETGANLSVAALRGTVARLQAGGGKVLISTAGGVIPGCSGDWTALLTPERRAATVAALVDLADPPGCDGVGIDIRGTNGRAWRRARVCGCGLNWGGAGRV